MFTVYRWQRVCGSVWHFSGHTLPEYAVRCGEIKATTICFFNISYIHLNGCDANSYSVVLGEKRKKKYICSSERESQNNKYHLKLVEIAERTIRQGFHHFVGITSRGLEDTLMCDAVS